MFDSNRKFSLVFFIGLGALLLFAFALRAFQLGAQDIWWDEGRNIFTASHPLDAIASAKELDIHPPLYFYLLHFWIALAGTGEFAVRFFSLWFGVAIVALAFRLGTYLKDRHVGWWAAFLITVSPFFVDEAQQTRMYTLLIFLSTLSIYLLLRAVNTQHRKYWIGYTLAAVASFYVHYSFVYVLAVQNLYLAFEFWNNWRHRQSPRQYLLGWAGSQVAIAFLYLFQVPNILRQLQIYGNPGMTPPPLSQYITDLTRAFLLGEKVEIEKMEIAAWGVVAALVIALVAALIRRREALTRRDAVIILIWFTVPLIAYFIVLQKSPQFTPRYAMLATPPFYLLLALFLGKLSRRSVVVGAVPAIVLLAANAGAWQSLYFNPAFLNDDTRGLAQFISETATKDDIVFIDVPFPFDYYYRGVAPAHYLFVDIHATADVLTQMTQNKKRIFWITWYKSDTDPRGYVPYLLDKYAISRGAHDFRGYHVVWYRLPTTPMFSLAPPPQPATAVFGNRLTLTGFAFGGVITPSTPNADEPLVAVGRKAWVALWWKLIQPANENYTVSVVLRDAKGSVVAQEDRRLLSDQHLGTQFWSTDETIINVYTPELEPGAGPGEYTLHVIVYDPATGERLNIGPGDAFLLGKMQVVPFSKQ